MGAQQFHSDIVQLLDMGRQHLLQCLNLFAGSLSYRDRQHVLQNAWLARGPDAAL